MSAGNACTCGRKRGDRRDMVVTCLHGNFSAFNGYHWTPSDWSAVRCLRPNCSGMWRTKSSYVFDLPDCTGDWPKVDRLQKEVVERIRTEQGKGGTP